jgi:hypothetical protein
VAGVKRFAWYGVVGDMAAWLRSRAISVAFDPGRGYLERALISLRTRDCPHWARE